MVRAMRRHDSRLTSDVALDDMLEGIHVMRVVTQVQMVAVLHTLDQWLEQHPSVSCDGLIIRQLTRRLGWS